MKRLAILMMAAVLPLAAACGKKKDAAARLDTFPVKTVPTQVRDLEETKYQVFWSDPDDTSKASREVADGSEPEKS